MPTTRAPVETLTGFLVDTHSEGFAVSRVEHKMGQRACPAAEQSFGGVRAAGDGDRPRARRDLADVDRVGLLAARDRRGGRPRDRARRLRASRHLAARGLSGTACARAPARAASARRRSRRTCTSRGRPPWTPRRRSTSGPSATPATIRRSARWASCRASCAAGTPCERRSPPLACRIPRWRSCTARPAMPRLHGRCPSPRSRRHTAPM